MRWIQNHDYHGSRAYDTDQPEISRWRLLAAWMANIAAQKFARRSEAAIPLFEGQAGAELSGRSAMIHDRRDSRVLP
jgi:hypothetical protein